MSQRCISGRQLRHGSPEESLAPGQSVRIEKRNGVVSAHLARRAINRLGGITSL